MSEENAVVELPADTSAEEAKIFENAENEGEVTPPEAVTETPAPAVEAEPAKPKVVPLEALHEARAANKELREQIRRSEEQRQQMERRFSEMMERLTPRQAPPAFEENPAEHLRAKVEQTQEQLQSFAETQKKQQQEAQFLAWYQGESSKFAQQQTDFMPAYQSFMTTRAQELENSGASAGEIQERLRQEERAIVIAAAQGGVNPAQVIYNMAVAKGYKTAKAETPQPDPNKLQTIANGIKSSKSLSHVQGKATENLTLAYLANLPKHEFQKYADDWENTMSRITG